MSRVINTNSPTKIRNQNQRTIAEILRHIFSKTEMDEDAKDMASQIVFCLRAINETVETTMTAWEKRDYWMKAERFMREWEWSQEAEYNIDDVIRHEAWDLLPALLAKLSGQFSAIQVKKMTRDPLTWKGAHKYLLRQPPSKSPW